MRLLSLLVAALVCSSCQLGAPVPTPTGGVTAMAGDPCHPAGIRYCALNPDVTQETIRETICVSGWTATIRPPSSYTSKLKAEQMVTEHLSGTAADYEEDHRVALELGGAASDPFNLSPEPRAGSPNNSILKDQAENQARRQVCDQDADLRDTQIAFIKRWLVAYPGYA